MERITQYLRALLRVSAKSYESGELVESILTALLGLCLVVLTAWGVIINSEVGHIAAWIGGVGFVLLFVFVAPFRLWLAETKKVEVFETAAKPKLVISDPIE